MVITVQRQELEPGIVWSSRSQPNQVTHSSTVPTVTSNCPRQVIIFLQYPGANDLWLLMLTHSHSLGHPSLIFSNHRTRVLCFPRMFFFCRFGSLMSRHRVTGVSFFRQAIVAERQIGRIAHIRQSVRLFSVGSSSAAVG